MCASRLSHWSHSDFCSLIPRPHLHYPLPLHHWIPAVPPLPQTFCCIETQIVSTSHFLCSKWEDDSQDGLIHSFIAGYLNLRITLQGTPTLCTHPAINWLQQSFCPQTKAVELFSLSSLLFLSSLQNSMHAPGKSAWLHRCYHNNFDAIMRSWWVNNRATVLAYHMKGWLNIAFKN